MGRQAPNSPFDRVASPADVAAYDPEAGNCCCAEDFHVDIKGYPNSEWNKSCARVFAESFLAKYQVYDSPLVGSEKVEEAWITHFKTLRQTYAKQHSTETKNEAANSRKRRGERKSQVSNNITTLHRCLFCF
jgi:hypothetical protein